MGLSLRLEHVWSEIAVVERRAKLQAHEGAGRIA